MVVFEVISEQRAAGAGCVGEGIDESANGQHAQHGETDPRHYLGMSYTSSPATRPCHTPRLSDKSCPVPWPGDICTGDINVKTLWRGWIFIDICSEKCISEEKKILALRRC